MKTYFLKLALLFTLLLFKSPTFCQIQNLLSELWSGTGGVNAMFHKNQTVAGPLGSSYVAGSTINMSNSDVFIQKFDSRGNLLWSETYPATPLSISFHPPVKIIASNSLTNASLFVLSTLYNYNTGDFNLLIKKYNDSGVLQWSYLHNNSYSSSIDFGTGITTDGSSIYVTGASQNSSTSIDFMTLSLNINTGEVQWEERYDYNNLQHYPAKIIHKNGVVYVTGASQDGLSGFSWSIMTVSYNASTGALISSRRINSNAVSGINDISDLTVDNQNNLYIVGAKYSVTTNLDIAIYKLDQSLNLVWENFYDFNGLDDKGEGLKVDISGNIFVTGYSTSSLEGKQVAVLKLDSYGNEIWKTEFGGVFSGDDSGVNLVLDGDKLFVAASVVDEINSNYKLFAMDTSGRLLTEATFNGTANLDDIPEGIAIDSDGGIIVTGKEQTGTGTYINKTIRYVFDERLVTFSVDSNNLPIFVENELIVRFNRNVVNANNIDRKGFVVGVLSDFLDSTTIDTIGSLSGLSLENNKTYKIFQRLTTADSLSISRLGDTINVEAFWATFLIIINAKNEELAIAKILNSIPDSILYYAEPNYVIAKDDIPNDDLAQIEQAGLIPTSSLQNADINMDPAWDIETGKCYVNVGVFDDPIYWSHEDFGDGTWGGSKIIGGWDYFSNSSIVNINNPISSHGTACAGIIGALRNNNIGIAGIAGGDIDGNGNTGAQLFSFGIFDGGIFSTIDKAASSIVEGSHSTTSGYGYGLAIQNHSWGGSNYTETIDKAVTSAWRNHCTVVASRGNLGSLGNPMNYPACLSDAKVLNTGASGNDGAYKSLTNGENWWTSSYGSNVDFIAPGISELVTSTYNPNFPIIYSNCNSSKFPLYGCFNGTSSSAPHVAGVAALMYSKHHTAVGAPNNLATEDIERILQKTATDKGIEGYDDLNGWGLINAYSALKKVEHPLYYVKHSSNIPSTQNMSSNINVVVLNNTDDVAAGYYIADLYKISWTYIDLLPADHEIIDYWQIEASTYSGVSDNIPITGTRWMNVMPDISIGNNAAVINVYTFAWFIKRNVNYQIINRWIPSGGPNHLKYAYSLHVRDNSLVSTAKSDKISELNIFPNPTENILNLTFVSSGNEATLEIIDAQGKIVSSPKLGYKEEGEHTVKINIENLAKGIYLIKISNSENFIFKKFIKR